MPSLLRTGLMALIALLAFVAPARAAIETAHLERSVVRIVIIVEDGDGELYAVGHGSGFAVAPDRVVTNAHVIEPAVRYGERFRTAIVVVPSRGEGPLIGQLLDSSELADLALIRLTDGTLPRATLFDGAVGPDTDVVALGYPGNIDRALGRSAASRIRPAAPERTEARLSSIREGAPWNASLQTYIHDARIGSGYSGGPLADACGRVIGVNTATTVNDEGDAAYAFSIAGPGLRAFLRGNNVDFAGTTEPCLSDADAARARFDKELKQRDDATRRLADQARMEKLRQEDLLQKLADQQSTQRRNDLISLGLGIVLIGGTALAGWRFRRKDYGWMAVGAAAAVAALGGIIFVQVSTPATVNPMRPGGGSSAIDSSSGDAIKPDGDVRCTLDRASSHVTLTNAGDTEFGLANGLCVNGKTLYARDGKQLTRVMTSPDDESVSTSQIDLTTGRFTTELYQLDKPTYESAARLAKKYGEASCGADPAKMAARIAETTALLPPKPTQTLVWDCRSAR